MVRNEGRQVIGGVLDERGQLILVLFALMVVNVRIR
jgi:hypothetical protein